MPHLPLGQHRVCRFLHRLTVPVGDQPTAWQPSDPFEVRTGEDLQDTGHRRRRRSVNSLQVAVGNLRPKEMDMSLSVNVHVVGVLSVSRQEPNILAALRACANTKILWHSFLHFNSRSPRDRRSATRPAHLWPPPRPESP